jgi:MtrB/PioB family decaheme-associated outer membrane protein
MRAHVRVLILLPIMVAPPAFAQTIPPGQQPSAPTSQVPTGTLAPRIGLIDFGVRFDTVDGDRARFQRFRDLRDGPVLDLLRYSRDTESWTFNAAFDHVGYRDQRYLAEFDRVGRMRATFEWNQIPLFYSEDTRTPYTHEAENVFRLPDALQASIQNGQATIADAGRAAASFQARQRRDIADLRYRYTASANTEFQLGVTSTGKTGEQPWAASFGSSPGTIANILPLPLDQRTNDVTAGLEWANDRGMLRVAYDGSFFNNRIESIVFDNALRLTDGLDAASQGRMSISPSSTANSVSGIGAMRLPARSRAHAYVSIGRWNQNEPLLPHTINTALPVIPLDRDTAEAEARIVAMNLGLNSRPTNLLWLNARFRLYDYDNRTPHYAQTQYVRMDSTVATSVIGGSEPFGYTRQFLDLDASFTPLRFVGFRLGYGREHDDRTFRFLEKTTEHVIRASIDTTGTSWVSARALYEYAKRTGEGFDEEALSDIGEQVSLRQFDISDRNRSRLSAIVQVLPTERVGVTAQVGVGSDNRPDAQMGLRDNDHHFYNIALDLTPVEDVVVALAYGRENYATLQRSRQANPGAQFNDPARDWTTDMGEHADTVTANLDLPHLAPRTTVRLTYDFNRSRAQYVYGLAPNSTLVAPEQLPPVTNQLQRSRAEVVYDLTRHLGIGVSYWFDRYEVDDFAFDALTPPFAYVGSGLFLGYLYRDYTAHTGWARLIVNW